mmetsp:Transcript_60374/g.141112  ORF Transcript_60374/g.141112 Transcript_60374/m.141112 type:complete len:212 (+) Transcript_60374:226-861(+)
MNPLFYLTLLGLAAKTINFLTMFKQSSTAGMMFAGIHRRRVRVGQTQRHVVAGPPVLTRPPDAVSEISTGAEWTECLIKNPFSTAKHPDAVGFETWVLRTEDLGDFQRLLKIRGFENTGESSSLSCRQRQVDAEIRCSECVRLLRGGYYGHLGVSVPAYPPQQDAVGCLMLSKTIDMPAPATEEDDSGDWDGDQGRQTAFCNSVNVRLDKV